jgi:hypothetical protein
MFDVSDKQLNLYEQEVTDKYYPVLVAQSKKRVAKFTKQDWAAIKCESDTICQELTAQLNLPPENQVVQDLAKRYHVFMNRFYDCSLPILHSLGNMYVEDPRFKANYDKYDEKLAEFLRDALHIYCAKHTTCKDTLIIHGNISLF